VKPVEDEAGEFSSDDEVTNRLLSLSISIKDLYARFILITPGPPTI